MTIFTSLPLSERRLIIEQVAARRGILPVIVEKHFWVCWVLGRIFATPAMATNVVFKGGTFLSKVFGRHPSRNFWNTLKWPRPS